MHCSEATVLDILTTACVSLFHTDLYSAKSKLITLYDPEEIDITVSGVRQIGFSDPNHAGELHLQSLKHRFGGNHMKSSL